MRNNVLPFLSLMLVLSLKAAAEINPQPKVTTVLQTNAATLLKVSANSSLQSQPLLPDAPSATKLKSIESRDPTVLDHKIRAGDRGTFPEGFVGLVKRGVRDQAEIYSAPFHKSTLKVDLGVAAVTSGLIVTEPDSSEKLGDIPRSTSVALSDIGLYGTIGTVGTFYVSSFVTHDAHAKEAGFLGAEAIANAAVTFNLLKFATGRERPLVATQNGRFWQYSQLSSSFPSGHSAVSWAGATVIAHEYPKQWVQILSYGTATAVAFTRYSGRQHFASDAFFGAVVGYFIGSHVFHAHCQEELSDACSLQ